MSKIVVNKRRTKADLILKRLLVIFFLIIIFTSIFWFNFISFKFNILTSYIESFSIKYDYLLKEVEVSGLNNVSEVEINNYFEKYYNKSIFLISLKEISQKIEKNNWIESAKLKNNFKNKISIYIKELKPIAIFFNGKNYLLINKSGNIIDVAQDKEIQRYLILEGQNASKQAFKLIEAIPKKLKSTIIKARYINNRRWNIYTKENLRIRLPEIEYKKAMNIFIDIYDDLYFSDITKIEFVDLRIPEKVIIKFYNENN